ncbi:beta/alpha barrel domain-containing protein [Novipirellula artificiosorum]|uniref:Dihydroorotate dehydrogenase B (NAD(+)), catalytic subunit n=1 Tax=Novipirellula artificiosorum TaxID=2528016 RepID=A0A5C6DML2_9BACT|nr:dihydroorotate dehydrogenase [Novipirellula artificiosorum]TWU36099.1 Dihydroorotate dehydrogenase B (NAD(+)), catalytic subunit [Novipirellula artificiosorum]
MFGNITARYLGLELKSPVLVGSSSLARDPEAVRDLWLAGAGAIVLPSLFEEQVMEQRFGSDHRESIHHPYNERLSYGHVATNYNGGTERYLELIAELKRTSLIPIIANLNGFTHGQWLSIASEIERAGAAAIELVVDCDITDPNTRGEQIEQCLIDCVAEVCDQVAIPVSVKLSSFHTSIANLTRRIADAGAKGVVCFAHAPAWRVETECIDTTLHWSLTAAGNINPTIAGLIRARGAGASMDIAASGGICSTDDFVRSVIAGADVAMMTSAVYRSGPSAITKVVNGLQNYLSRSGFASFAEFAAARPKLHACMRSSYLRGISEIDRYHDPTPQPTTVTGDRYGHLDHVMPPEPHSIV